MDMWEALQTGGALAVVIIVGKLVLAGDLVLKREYLEVIRQRDAERASHLQAVQKMEAMQAEERTKLLAEIADLKTRLSEVTP